MSNKLLTLFAYIGMGTVSGAVGYGATYEGHIRAAGPLAHKYAKAKAVESGLACMVFWPAYLAVVAVRTCARKLNIASSTR